MYNTLVTRAMINYIVVLELLAGIMKCHLTGVYVEPVATEDQPVQTGYRLVLEKIGCNWLCNCNRTNVDWT